MKVARAHFGDAVAHVRSLRIFFVGGLLSYRALFGWLSPWILIPTFMVAPIFQILLFTYIGRAARIESDQFFLIGNALQYASLPCIFAMANTIAGERQQLTLGPILASPAPRLPLFLGRAAGDRERRPARRLRARGGRRDPRRARAGLRGGAAGTRDRRDGRVVRGLGLVTAAVGLRVRETAVLSNIVFGLLLVFCGVNVPLDELPAGMSAIAQGLPLTHGIAAARQLGAEALVGACWGIAGYALLRFFELQSLRHATLERA